MQQIIVRDGRGEETVAQVKETYEHGGDTFARVDTGFGMGWVEMPEHPREPTHVLVCEDCGHYEEQPDGREELVGVKENRCNLESNAQGLKHFHEILRPSHNPRVVARP